MNLKNKKKQIKNKQSWKIIKRSKLGIDLGDNIKKKVQNKLESRRNELRMGTEDSRRKLVENMVVPNEDMRTKVTDSNSQNK